MSETMLTGSPIALPQHLAAKALGVTDRTLRNWDRAGLITGHRPKPGGVKLYAVEALKRLTEKA